MDAKNSAAFAAAMPSDREILFTRELDAPRKWVWKAWTEQEHLARWWGPKGFILVVSKLDLRPGGLFHYSMRASEGIEIWGKFVYREIYAPERIVFVSSFADESGNLTRHFANPTWPLEVLNTLTFCEQDGKTTITLKCHPIEASDVERKTFRDGHKSMHQVLLGTLDQLAEYLASMKKSSAKTVLVAEQGKSTTILSRVFDAPRKLVFEAYTNPVHIPQWWGRKSYKTVVDKMDVRPGGVWRYVQLAPDGKEFAFRGVYKEIVPQERIVSTLEYEAMPIHVIENTATFEEHDGRTTVTITSRYPTVEVRDGMLEAGMELGAIEAWDMLEELLPKLATIQNNPTKYEIVLSRVFDAPRDLVWKAWTDPKQLVQWWGPRGFTNPVCEVNLRPGGAILIHMRAPNGVVYPMKGVFQEIVAPERLVLLSGPADEAGKLLFEVLHTVTFDEQAGKTKITLHARVVNATPAAPQYLAGMEVGWTQSLERLNAFVTKA